MTRQEPGRARRIVAFANQKGGTGKSTTCGAFAEGLIRRGFKVLCIDLDPQGNLSFTNGADTSRACADSLLAPESPADLTCPADLEPWIQHPSYTDLIASGRIGDDNTLESRAKEISTDTAGGPWRLEDALAHSTSNYDFVLVDTPPNMDALTVNALAAADDVIVPCDMDVQSAKGFDVFLTYLRRFQRRMNRRLQIAGVIVTQFRYGVTSAQEFLDGMAAKCEAEGVPLIHSTIRMTDVVKRAHGNGIGIYEAVEAKRGAARIDIDYDCAIDQYLDGIGMQPEVHHG